MASGMDKAAMDRDHVMEHVQLASSLLSQPEQALQGWADDQPLGTLRSMPGRLRQAQAELERWQMEVSTLQVRVQGIVEAAARGNVAADEPQLAPMPAEGPGRTAPARGY
jgi:hypothetical protein